MTKLGEKDRPQERQAMLASIVAHAAQSAHETGREEISDSVMNAMAAVPRHLFVPQEFEPLAYEDTPLPIGAGKTISQPFMVALATDLLDLQETDKVLEVGAGLGYQAAVLAELCDQVFAIEILSELATEAEKRLRAAGYDHVRIRTGDGARGWPEEAPFDKIMVSAAAAHLPAALLKQLKPGGRMAIPVGGENDQRLKLIEKRDDGDVTETEIIPVRYSRLTVSH